MTYLPFYLDGLDTLRRQRAKPGWVPEDDRKTLSDLENLFSFLRADQIQLVELNSWRAWPDEFRKQGKDGMVRYLTTSSRWRMGADTSGPCWYHLGGNAIVVFYDELGEDAGNRIMEIER